jgi:chromate reductase, NAD(P)H dehydrogenase (quinone)
MGKAEYENRQSNHTSVRNGIGEKFVMPTDRFKVVALSGSLRKESLNTALLKGLVPLAPDSLDIRLHALDDLPLYSEDIDGEYAPPPATALRAAVAAADGLIIATPEYNRNMSGIIKNAIDWLSRPPIGGVARGKECLLLVATESTYHGMDAWVELSKLMHHLSNHVVEPDVIVHTAHLFLAVDSDGNVHITDEKTEQVLRIVLDSLAAALEAGLGHKTLESYQAFAEAIIRPRRKNVPFPLKLRSMADA